MSSTIQVLLRENVEVLRQGLVLLDKLDDDQFRTGLPALGLAGPGPHFRHVIDFYRRLLEGLEADAASPCVDYDRRERDPRIETERRACYAAIVDLQARLETIERVDRAIEVRCDQLPGTPSTLGRELQALVSHTVHHYALIAIAARGLGVDPGREFGVAPSTLAYWRECVS
ncbi:MAG: DinB family protein [Planctomycetota bacterium]